MNKESRVEALKLSAKQKKRRAEESLERAIQRLVVEGDPLTFASVARESGLSVSYLYKYPKIKNRINDLKNQQQKVSKNRENTTSYCHPLPQIEKLEPETIEQPKNDVGFSLNRKNRLNLAMLDECNLVVLEYIARSNLDGHGVTVVDVRSFLNLSNPATSCRLRRMSDVEYGQIDPPPLERIKSAAANGADLYFLAKWVSLADIQKIMTDLGYSYDRYLKRKKKIEFSRDRYSHSIIVANELKNESTEASVINSEEDEILEVIVRLVKEVSELKQNYGAIKEENFFLKEEVDNLKNQVTKLEKLQTEILANLKQGWMKYLLQNNHNKNRSD